MSFHLKGTHEVVTKGGGLTRKEEEEEEEEEGKSKRYGNYFEYGFCMDDMEF